MNQKLNALFGINLKFNVTILTVTFLYAAILCCLFILFPDFQVELKYLAAVSCGVAAIYSAFYVGRQLHITHKMRVRENSFRFLENLYSIEIVRIRSKLEKEFQHQDVTPGQFYDKITNDIELHTALRCVLNMFETISIAIQAGYVEEKVLHDMLHVIVNIHWNRYYPYIEAARERSKAPEIFCEFQKLYNAWSEKKYLSTGEIIEKV